MYVYAYNIIHVNLSKILLKVDYPTIPYLILFLGSAAPLCYPGLTTLIHTDLVGGIRIELLTTSCYFSVILSSFHSLMFCHVVICDKSSYNCSNRRLQGYRLTPFAWCKIMTDIDILVIGCTYNIM